MRILFLDDDEARHKCFRADLFAHGIQAEKHHVYTIAEAIMLLRASAKYGQPFDYAFLDHDLDGQVFVVNRERTGQMVADYIAQMPVESRPCRVVVHSMNPEGARLMHFTLNEARIRAERAVFGSNDFGNVLRRIAEQQKSETAKVL